MGVGEDLLLGAAQYLAASEATEGKRGAGDLQHVAAVEAVGLHRAVGEFDVQRGGHRRVAVFVLNRTPVRRRLRHLLPQGSVGIRLHVSFLNGDTTVGLAEVNVAKVGAKQTERWTQGVKVEGKDLRCILRVERTDA